MPLHIDLMAAGFTEYEAKVYLALLSNHPATGYQISKQAGIPRSMVYEALGRLHTRGAVLKTEEQRSSLYRPLPPDTLLDHFAEDHRQLIRSLRENLQALYITHDEDHLWSISGRSSILSFANRIIHDAEEEISLLVNDLDLVSIQDEVQKSYERGLKLNILLTGEAAFHLKYESNQDQGSLKSRIARHPPRESELQEITQMLLLTADEDTCLIASADPDKDSMTATITNNRNLVLIARQFVWMELFTQRIYTQIGADLLSRLNREDQKIFENFSPIDL
jgi:Cd2+/Zn2+-exporting ATPase